jgi:hypothetical protein
MRNSPWFSPRLFRGCWGRFSLEFKKVIKNYGELFFCYELDLWRAIFLMMRFFIKWRAKSTFLYKLNLNLFLK